MFMLLCWLPSVSFVASFLLGVDFSWIFAEQGPQLSSGGRARADVFVFCCFDFAFLQPGVEKGAEGSMLCL